VALEALAADLEVLNDAKQLFVATQLLKDEIAPDGQDTALEILQPLARDGDLRAQAMLGHALMGDPDQQARGLEMLEAASASGSLAAARHVIRFYLRAGRDRPEALTRLAALAVQFEADLSEAQRARIALRPLEVRLETAIAGLEPGSQHDSYQTLVEAYDVLPEGRVRTRALAKIWRANRNAYTYLMQDQLGRRGLYDGTRNGLMGTKTIEAFARFCRQIEGGAYCLLGPLNGRAVRVLAEHL
jgi:hypothetical protein